jgi:hypothetical protein
MLLVQTQQNGCVYNSIRCIRDLQNVVRDPPAAQLDVPGGIDSDLASQPAYQAGLGDLHDWKASNPFNYDVPGGQSRTPSPPEHPGPGPHGAASDHLGETGLLGGPAAVAVESGTTGPRPYSSHSDRVPSAAQCHQPPRGNRGR